MHGLQERTAKTDLDFNRGRRLKKKKTLIKLNVISL